MGDGEPRDGCRPHHETTGAAGDTPSEGERRFSMFMDNLPGLAWIKDANGRYVYANEAAAQAFRVPREELYGRTDEEIFPPETAAQFRENDRRALDDGVCVQAVETLEHEDGLHYSVVNKFPIPSPNGRAPLVGGIAVDITDRKLAEEERNRLLEREQRARQEAERASRLKDEFLATVSHELRTPLTAMLGWSRMLRTGKLDADGVARAVETIERNARAQAQIIEDLLDVSRIITGKLRLDVQQIDPSSVAASAIDAVRPAADAKGVHLRLLVEPDAGSISGDADRLQQILWNLVSNAVKFTPSGGQVEVSLRRVDAHIEIAVSDTGQGIEPEFLPHVFERFRQADATTTRYHSGLGLGLAIVRHLVEIHGGTVAAESSGKDRGAVFTVRLPLMLSRSESLSARTVALEPRPLREGSPPTAPAPELADVRILLVEDEQDAREFLASVLTGCSAHVLAVATAAEALATLDEFRPTVLVSDIGLPEIDGFELIRRVRSKPPERGGRVPAVALTAYARAEDRARALSVGFQVHVSKPVEPDDLVAVVASLVERVRP